MGPTCCANDVEFGKGRSQSTLWVVPRPQLTRTCVTPNTCGVQDANSSLDNRTQGFGKGIRIRMG